MQKHCCTLEHYREALVVANLSDHPKAAHASAAIQPPQTDPILNQLFNLLPDRVNESIMPQSLLLHASMSTPPDMHNVLMDIDGGPYLQLADKLCAATCDVIMCVLGEPDTVALLSHDDSTDTSSVSDIEVEGIVTLDSICCCCCLMHL